MAISFLGNLGARALSDIHSDEICGRYPRLSFFNVSKCFKLLSTG